MTLRGASYSLFQSDPKDGSFEPGIGADHANQFCQWVADVIVQHGGMMTVASEPGEFTAFTVKLPRVMAKETLQGDASK